MKKTLFLLAAVLVFAGFMSCDDNISFPVNHIEIHNISGKMPTFDMAQIHPNTNYPLFAVFLNSKNEVMPVLNSELIIWTTDCPTRQIVPATGQNVSFNPQVMETSSATVRYIQVEYKDLPKCRVNVQVQ